MRKYALLLLTLTLFLCGCTKESPEEPSETAEAFAATEIGSSSYSCITEESETREVTTETGTVMVTALSHRIYNPNNKYVVTLTTTVTCASDYSGIRDITGTLSDAQSEGFTVSEHLVGDTGTVIVYLNGLSVCYFQYRLHADGTLEFL